jgi:hypothetical protein
MSNLPPGWTEPDDGLSPEDVDRIEERAREYAAEDPDLHFPEDGNPEEITLTELPTDHYEYRFTATYRDHQVEVCVPGDIFDRYEPD